MLFSFVIVSYASGHELLDCLASLEAVAETKEIIVVNNGNAADIEMQLGIWSKVNASYFLIEGHGNIGFGAGCNLGAKRAKGETLIFLNPDCRVRSDFCFQIEAAQANQVTPALFGVWTVDDDGRPDSTNIRGEVGFLSVLALRFPKLASLPFVEALNRPLPSDPKALGDTYKTTGVSGGCMIITREFFEALNGFDEAFFLHFEDLDLQKRVRNEGGDIFLLPHLIVTHHKSSSRVKRSFVAKHKMRSWFLFMSKHSASRIVRCLSQCAEIVLRRAFLR